MGDGFAIGKAKDNGTRAKGRVCGWLVKVINNFSGILIHSVPYGTGRDARSTVIGRQSRNSPSLLYYNLVSFSSIASLLNLTLSFYTTREAFHILDFYAIVFIHDRSITELTTNRLSSTSKSRRIHDGCVSQYLSITLVNGDCGSSHCVS